MMGQFLSHFFPDNIARNAFATYGAHMEDGISKFGDDLQQAAVALRGMDLSSIGSQFGQHLKNASKSFENMRLHGLDAAGRDHGKLFGENVLRATELLTSHGIKVVGLKGVGRDFGVNFAERLTEVAKIVKDFKIHINGLSKLGLAEFGHSVDNAFSHLERIRVEAQGDIGPRTYHALHSGYALVTYGTYMVFLLLILLGVNALRYHDFGLYIIGAITVTGSIAYFRMWNSVTPAPVVQNRACSPLELKGFREYGGGISSAYGPSALDLQGANNPCARPGAGGSGQMLLSYPVEGGQSGSISTYIQA
ncbi:uncharacterized protein LOC129602423 [Paramacrobiotus metropolitanus]|uniref:uncharacterized protein LOC129602423 n=1 Tax=Paramacrobiotus metropolitanus TaxID=2943436 RepID=UPI0024463059|nr:uncharacterized protein LOC129602423 [Paramacrobiotus metropolitanus]XP_055357409.1 uncharacterized protein LOC129602423 [Paramacrobiotus metropolitanus]XP_055357410.1 uncharacterized protein LOC129602423 [Paramacrobiotus metropolitanus]